MSVKRDEFMKYVNAINGIKVKSAMDKNSVRNDELIPESAKKQELNKIRSAAIEQLRGYSEPAQNAFLAYYRECMENRPKLDLYGDDFVKTVNMIKSIGNELDDNAQVQIVERFAHNKEALNTLQGLFGKNNMKSATMACSEALQNMREADIGMLYDSCYFACTRDDIEPSFDSRYINDCLDNFEVSLGIK